MGTEHSLNSLPLVGVSTSPVRDDVTMFSQGPRNYLNAYQVGDILVDAGPGLRPGQLLSALDGPIRGHVLTHAHPDHQGNSAAVCRALDIPLWCHPDERQAVETGETLAPMPDTRASRLLDAMESGAGHPVADTLTEGDTVEGFDVIETPGNAPGHISLWREADGTLILGDVLTNLDVWTLRRGLDTVPEVFTAAPETSVRSARKVADLEPDVVCFGHGPPLYDGRRFREFVASL